VSSIERSAIADMARELRDALGALPTDERITALNEVRALLHEVSPFAGEPVDLVQWLPAALVAPNDYNPNKVAPPEMRLLQHSIRADGYTQPVVASPAEGGFEVVDGFHRTRIGKECRAVRDRVLGHLPVVVLAESRREVADRMAATIRHNRARGVHGVRPMADLVAELILQGWDDTQVAKELGMDADEVLRFKQTKGLPELFKGSGYSRSWE